MLPSTLPSLLLLICASLPIGHRLSNARQRWAATAARRAASRRGGNSRTLRGKVFRACLGLGTGMAPTRTRMSVTPHIGACVRAQAAPVCGGMQAESSNAQPRLESRRQLGCYNGGLQVGGASDLIRPSARQTARRTSRTTTHMRARFHFQPTALVRQRPLRLPTRRGLGSRSRCGRAAAARQTASGVWQGKHRAAVRSATCRPGGLTCCLRATIRHPSALLLNASVALGHVSS